MATCGQGRANLAWNIDILEWMGISRYEMVDFQKLKHEWKTFSLAVITSVIGIWDTAASSGYDLSPIIPEKYRPYAVPAIGISFLMLRRWTNKKDEHVEHNQ